MRNLSRNDGRPKPRGRAGIARHVCTWVSLTWVVGCVVPGTDLSGRACPCIADWVCDEQTQRCVEASQSGVEPRPRDDGRSGWERVDAGRANPPDWQEPVDAATSASDAATMFADARIPHVPPGDASHGDNPDAAGFLDADTPDAAHHDSGQEAGVVIPPEPDAGSEPCDDPTTMLPAERKGVGEYLCSNNGQYRFGLSPNGSLELRTSQALIWSSGSCCGVSLAMQRDGNMVVYNSADAAVFATNTRGNDGAFLRVEDDGRAKLWLGTRVIWSTTIQ